MHGAVRCLYVSIFSVFLSGVAWSQPPGAAIPRPADRAAAEREQGSDDPKRLELVAGLRERRAEHLKKLLGKKVCAEGVSMSVEEKGPFCPYVLLHFDEVSVFLPTREDESKWEAGRLVRVVGVVQLFAPPPQPPLRPGEAARQAGERGGYGIAVSRWEYVSRIREPRILQPVAE